MKKAEHLSPGAALTLAEGGASEYVIVLSAAATEAEIRAAGEFRKYFSQITGANLPVVTDETPAAAREIVIGRTNREAAGEFDRAELGQDGYIVKTDGGKLWLVGGGDLGTEYAVYGFLEDHLGCRFYTPDFEKIPRRPDVSLSIPEDRRIPVFRVRSVHDGIVWRDAAFSRRRRVNNPNGLVYAVYPHSLPILAGTGDEKHGPDPCLTKEETFGKVMAAIREKLAAAPGANCVSVSTCDNYGPETKCSCPACTARIEEYGMSGHYLLFVNRVAETLAKEYPGVFVHTFAYNATLLPPKKKMRAADNVIAQVCTKGCGVHSLTECTMTYGAVYEGGREIDFAAVIREWGEICHCVYIWDYTPCFNCYAAPWPAFGTYAANYRLFAESNVKLIFSQGPGRERNGEFDFLRCYLICRLVWDPLMTEEQYYAYMDEFLADWYGPGWRHIRAFIDFCAAAVWKDHVYRVANPGQNFPMTLGLGAMPALTAQQVKDFRNVDWEPYWDCLTPVVPHPILREGPKFFEAAREMAETEEQRFRIERSAIQLDVLDSYRMYRRCELAAPTLELVYQYALDAAVASGEIGKGEREGLLRGFREYIKDKPLAEYTAYNRRLAEKMISYDIRIVNEHHHVLDPAVFDTEWDFANQPHRWS